MAPVAVPARAAAATGDPAVAGAAITALGFDLFAAVRSSGAGGNVTVSPASVAVALAMLEPGAVDQARAQFGQLLRIGDPAAFHRAVNALTLDLDGRAPPAHHGGEAEVTLRMANAAFLQQGYALAPAYLAAVGAHYGPALHEVDFPPDPDAVAHQINRFVAERTNDRITELIGDGVLQALTRLVLVNALYLKASWLDPFDPARTADAPFTRLDGARIRVPMMRGGSSSSARGDGWVGAGKWYVGGLEAQFILPDPGRFDEVAGRLGPVFAAYEEHRGSGGPLAVPRLVTRFHTELDPALRSLGLRAPYTMGQLLGVADDPQLVIGRVIHETWLAIDEEGTEAAAATAVLVVAAGLVVREEPVPVELDRPFLWRIVDARSGATLFVGQVVDLPAEPAGPGRAGQLWRKVRGQLR